MHDWLKATLSKDNGQELSDIALACIACTIPSLHPSLNWPLLWRYLPHVDSYFLHIKSQAHDADQQAKLCKLGDFYFDLDNYKKAETIFSQVLNHQIKSLGETNLNILSTKVKLICTYFAGGELVRAIEFGEGVHI